MSCRCRHHHTANPVGPQSIRAISCNDMGHVHTNPVPGLTNIQLSCRLVDRLAHLTDFNNPLNLLPSHYRAQLSRDIQRALNAVMPGFLLNSTNPLIRQTFDSTVEPVLGDPWFGRPLVLGDHNHRHGSFLTIKYLT